MRGFEPSIPALTRTPEMRPFWDGCRTGKLLVTICADCEQFHFGREAACPACGSKSLEWKEATGRGHLYSYVICYSPALNAQEGTPSVIAIIQLDEGPRVMTSLSGLEDGLSKLKVGIPVEAVFHHSPQDGPWAFSFCPASHITK